MNGLGFAKTLPGHVEKARCPPCSSSSSSSSSSDSGSCFTTNFCRPCDAIQTVIDVDDQLLSLINAQNFAGVQVLCQPGGTFQCLDPYSGICLKQAGCIKNLWATCYKGVRVYDVIQSVNYQEDGSVVVKAVEVTRTCDDMVKVRDMTRIYTTTFGCNYKLNAIHGVDFLCRTN